MPEKKKTFKDAKAEWLKATPKQRKERHFKIRIMAAEARGESEEFIEALKAERDKVLAEMK